MELKVKNKLKIEFSYENAPNNPETEKIRKDGEKTANEIQKFYVSILQSYEKAKTQEEFEQSFFVLWYGCVKRTSFPLL